MLGFHDKTMEFEDIDVVADAIEQVIQETNPSLIITFYPDQAVHPDHDACGRAVIHALSRMPLEQRPVVYALAITKKSSGSSWRAGCCYRYKRCTRCEACCFTCAPFPNGGYAAGYAAENRQAG
ncbi:hypothetical protein GCM10020331_058120 [Ectobacillus funiculus]